MAIYRVMSILQGASGDPKDRYVNNFHFRDGNNPGTIPPEVWTNIGEALDNFWEVVDEYIPATITREDYRGYVLSDPTPRPVTFIEANAQPEGAGAAYPYEVSAVLSYYAGRNIPRRRGRIFLGPLTTSVGATGAVNHDPQISAAFRTAVTAAAAQLQTDAEDINGPAQATWSVWSPTDEESYRIDHVWMDNAFDTIRKRGTGAETRTVLEL